MSKGLYLRLFPSIVENPKVYKLADLLNISYAEALYLLIRIWSLVLNRSSKDGDLSNYESKYLAAAVRYEQDQDLYEALVEARLMTADKKLYDWDLMSGKGISDIEKTQEANRRRQQKYRDKNKND